MAISVFGVARRAGHVSKHQGKAANRIRLSVEELESRYVPSVVLQSFDGTSVPMNPDGDYYPNEYTGEGTGNVSINTSNSISGNSLQLALSSGLFYAQFNPYNYTNNPAYPSPRGFAHNYAEDAANWQFNTYDRLVFWIYRPATAVPYQGGGQFTTHFGTYVKTVSNPDLASDEAGGGHFYHYLNLPNVGAWTQVVINTHPTHERGDNGGFENGNLPHPTGESDYNYFDALTRFYVEDVDPNSSYPANYLLDNFSVYQEPYLENDQQVYSVTGTYVPDTSRIILTWSRNKDENTIKQEVRYSFSDIHQTGWDAATPAPNGVITPPGWQGYNGMVYDTTALPLSGHSVVYIAIKPQNSNLFTQIAIPLGSSSESQATPTVTASDSGGTFNGNPFPASATAKGSDGSAVSGSFAFTYYAGSSATGAGTSTAPTNSGTYTVVAAFTSSDVHYSDAQSAPVTFTIGKAHPTVTAKDSGGPYTGNPYPASATATGVGGATVNGSFAFTYYNGTTATGTGTSTAPSSPGTYTVVASFTSSNSNYNNAASPAVTFSITSTSTSQAPTVARVAKATPSPVIGKTTTLSVLGADDGGEANLRYTWSVISKPSGATTPTFSSNGTNAAKNSVATFYRAGVYKFKATIRDAAGHTVTSNVSVKVVQTLTTLKISPPSAQIYVGQSVQFHATAYDQFGVVLVTQPSFKWTLTGAGKITSSGAYSRYYAPMNAGGPYTIAVQAGNLQKTASVTVKSFA